MRRSRRWRRLRPAIKIHCFSNYRKEARGAVSRIPRLLYCVAAGPGGKLKPDCVEAMAICIIR
jgi:hypothetical protein